MEPMSSEHLACRSYWRRSRKGGTLPRAFGRRKKKDGHWGWILGAGNLEINWVVVSNMFMFTPRNGEDSIPILTSLYFSRGLVQPPSSQDLKDFV